MKAYMLMAEGFEEVEAVATADVLKRGGIEVQLLKVTKSEFRGVNGAHGIRVGCDASLADTEAADYFDGDALILPGGQPGTRNLAADEKVHELIEEYYGSGKVIAAICAAPTVFGKYGILDGKKATCFPGCESGLGNARFVGGPAVTDGNIITGKSMGCAIDFGLAIVGRLLGEAQAAALEKKLERK